MAMHENPPNTNPPFSIAWIADVYPRLAPPDHPVLDGDSRPDVGFPQGRDGRAVRRPKFGARDIERAVAPLSLRP